MHERVNNHPANSPSCSPNVTFILKAGMERVFKSLHGKVSANTTGAMKSFLNNLHGKVSTNTTILTKDDLAFASAHERWSNIDRKTPAIIIQPATEHDVAVLVRCLLIPEPLPQLVPCADQSFDSFFRSKLPMKRTSQPYLQRAATALGQVSMVA